MLQDQWGSAVKPCLPASLSKGVAQEMKWESLSGAFRKLLERCPLSQESYVLSSNCLLSAWNMDVIARASATFLDHETH